MERAKLLGPTCRLICFEITETAAIAQLATATELIERLHALGLYFSLDDFGSGLSSFGYLKHLKVDSLKIDGLFVRDMDRDPIDLASVRAMNDVGHAMKITTVAESVESDAVLDLLRVIGVDYAQDYAVEPPRPLSDLEPHSASRGPAPEVATHVCGHPSPSSSG
jgi:EAL domain-containing protein (putative c-di-GMP-specific phosphodiesterase class I)